MTPSIFIFIFAFLVLSITGCANDTPEFTEITDASLESALELSKYNAREYMVVNAELISLENEDKQYDLIFDVKNLSGEDIYYGLRWYLEILKDGDWYRIDFLRDENGDVGEVIDMAIILENNKHAKIKVPLYGYYQVPLEAGKYRLVQPINGKLLSLPFAIK